MCVAAADIYHLDPSEAHAIIDEQIAAIRTNWGGLRVADQEAATDCP